MTAHHEHLACPDCGHDLEPGQEGLACSRCATAFPIVNEIPRFTPPENYAAGFGFQWNKHFQTQFDSQNGSTISTTRFFDETKWPRDLSGEVILEVGSGSGRFTEPAATTNATVVTIDYSSAVEANYKMNGEKDNVLVAQGDLYRLPVRERYFDRVFCFGVLQHTPDVERSFASVARHVKPGGHLAVDVYSMRRYAFFPNYLARTVTKHMPAEQLYKMCEWYVHKTWGVTSRINRLPRGRYITKMMLVGDCRGQQELPENVLKDWTVLNTFDTLAPAYDSPTSAARLTQWFEKYGFEDISVHPGHNGIEGRGRRRLSN